MFKQKLLWWQSSDFSFTWPFRNQSFYLLLKKHFLLLSQLEMVVLL